MYTIDSHKQFIILSQKESLKNGDAESFLVKYSAFSKSYLDNRFKTNEMIQIFKLWTRYPEEAFSVLIPDSNLPFPENRYPVEYWKEIINIITFANFELSFIQSCIFVSNCYYNKAIETGVDINYKNFDVIRTSAYIVKGKKNKNIKKNLTKRLWHWHLFLVLIDKSTQKTKVNTTRLLQNLSSKSPFYYSKTKKKEAFINVVVDKLSEEALNGLTDALLDSLFFIYEQKPLLFTEREAHSISGNTTLSILDNLFQAYSLPVMLAYQFLDWGREKSLIEKNWLKHLLKGGGFRELPHSPFYISKNLAAILMDIMPPLHMSFKETLVLAALINKGLSIDNGKMIVKESIFSQDIHFFLEIAVPLFEKLEIKSQFINFWDFLVKSPVEIRSEINIKTINLQRLSEMMALWHLELQKIRKESANQTLPSAEIDTLEFSQENEKTYRIRQLLTSADVRIQGRLQKNCVASYLPSLQGNKHFIFSLDVFANQKWSPLLTIELQNNKIVQVQGKYNSEPTEQLESLINQWAELNDLIINY